jgi:hypothetical protein
MLHTHIIAYAKMDITMMHQILYKYAKNVIIAAKHVQTHLHVLAVTLLYIVYHLSYFHNFVYVIMDIMIQQIYKLVKHAHIHVKLVHYHLHIVYRV